MRIMYQEEAKIGGELTPLKIIFQKLGGGGGGLAPPSSLQVGNPMVGNYLKYIVQQRCHILGSRAPRSSFKSIRALANKALQVCWILIRNTFSRNVNSSFEEDKLLREFLKVFKNFLKFSNII